ncbi:MAG: SMC-Scp complex subunit ScpB [Pseudomonadota bacterium]
MNRESVKAVVEAALFAANEPLSINRLQHLFEGFEGELVPDDATLASLLSELREEYAGRGVELVAVASGWRFQTRADWAPWVSRLWEERPQRYSRALLETLAVIAYRQPLTRGDVEDIRGVSVSTPIMKTLQEREWVRAVGHRDVPGRPALYATTRAFLDHFNLTSLDDLPTLAELRDIDEINAELDLRDAGADDDAASPADATDEEAGADTDEGAANETRSEEAPVNDTNAESNP